MFVLFASIILLRKYIHFNGLNPFEELMIEIDCSELPDDIATEVLSEIEGLAKSENHNHVNVIFSASVILIQSNDQELYGRIKQKVGSTTQKKLREKVKEGDLSREEAEDYRNKVVYRS